MQHWRPGVSDILGDENRPNTVVRVTQRPAGRSRFCAPDLVARIAAWTAAVLGVSSALISLAWASGSDVLIDTVGGSIERWGRDGGAGVVVVLALIGVLKLVVALAPPILVGDLRRWLPPWTTGRTPRMLGWVAAVTLAVYGGGLTVVGLLVQAGAIDASSDADERALAWHAYFWDPWFALWGAAFIVALARTRPSRSCRSPRRPAAPAAGAS